jgi:hypothetical protein
MDLRHVWWVSISIFKPTTHKPKWHAIKGIRTFKKGTKQVPASPGALFPYNRCLFIFVCMGKRHEKHISDSVRVSGRDRLSCIKPGPASAKVGLHN